MAKLPGIYELMATAASPAINFGRGLLGYQDPFLTQTMQDRMTEIESEKGPTGNVGYEDYGLQTATPGGRFTGGLMGLALNNPVDFGLAGSIGRYSYSPEGRTGLTYDFTPDQDTGSTGSATLDFINRGGLRGAISRMGTAQAAEVTPNNVVDVDATRSAIERARQIEQQQKNNIIRAAPTVFDINTMGDPALNPGSVNVFGVDPFGVNEDLIDRGNPTGDPRIVSEELGSVGFARPTMADVAGASLPLGATSQYDQSAVDGYQDLIMNPENNPNALNFLRTMSDIDNMEFEEIPGFNFIDAPTSLASRLKNLEYINNPRRGFIDNTLLARGNPNAGLVARTREGIGSLLSKIPTPFNLARGFLNAITGPRRVTTGMVYDDRGRGYTPAELNKMNAKGGYYSEPAREQRRRERRVEKMLERKAAGKSYSQKNLNKLTTGGSKPGTYTVKGAGSAGEGRGGKSIVCTAMYQTTGLQDWKKAMKIWYIYQKKHLTDTHQEGYHWLFKPFVKAMKKSKIVEALGAHVAKHRTQELKHVLFNSKSDKLGKVYNMILEPICFIAGKIKSALGRG